MTAIAAQIVRPRVAAVAGALEEVSRERDARWSLMLICACVYLMAAVARVHQLWPVIGMLRPAMLSGAAALLLILLDHGTSARLRAVWAIPGLRWVVALLVWAALSIPMALYPGGAFDIVANNLAKAVAMLVAVVVAVRGIRDVRRVTMVFFVGTVTFALVVLSKFNVEQATDRFAKLVYYDANEFALLAASALPLGAYLAWQAERIAARIAWMAGMAVAFIVFVSCGSRGGVVGLAAGLLVTVTTLRAIRLRWRVTAIVVVMVAFAATASEQFWQRMSDAVDTQEDYNLTSPTGRLEIWKRGFDYMLDHPILGVGAGNFATAEGTLSSYAARLRERSGGIKWSVAHNSYVQVGAELGVPGLLFYCAALFGSIRAMRRVSHPRHPVAADAELVGLAYAATVALVVFAVGSAFLSLAYSDMLFALLAIAMGVQVVARQRRRALVGVR